MHVWHEQISAAESVCAAVRIAPSVNPAGRLQVSWPAVIRVWAANSACSHVQVWIPVLFAPQHLFVR